MSTRELGAILGVDQKTVVNDNAKAGSEEDSSPRGAETAPPPGIGREGEEDSSPPPPPTPKTEQQQKADARRDRDQDAAAKRLDRERRSAVEHAIRAGDLLIEAKAQVRHGEWLPWLAENFPASERLAQSYMRLAANPQRSAHFDSVDAALKELAEPRAEPEEPAPEVEPEADDAAPEPVAPASDAARRNRDQQERAWDLWLDCWTQQAIADEIGVTQRTVSGWLEEMADLPDLLEPPESRQHFDVWTFHDGGGSRTA